MDKITLKTYVKIYSKKHKSILNAMVKALSSPVASFLNTSDDNIRLEAAKMVLKAKNKGLKSILN